MLWDLFYGLEGLLLLWALFIDILINRGSFIYRLVFDNKRQYNILMHLHRYNEVEFDNKMLYSCDHCGWEKVIAK